MRICVDFTSAIGDRTGVGTYTRELVRALLDLPTESSALLDLPTESSFRLALHSYRRPGWHRRLRQALAGTHRPFEVRPNRLLPHGALLELGRLLPGLHAEVLFGACDVFHGTNFLAPPCLRARSVATVHDLAFVRLADELAVPHRYGRYVEKALARTDRIIAVSEATKRDVVELFGISPERVAVVYEGAPREFPTLAPEEFARARSGYGIPERYFLFVGTIEPRKNLARLIRAFRRARRRIGGTIGLVLAGRPGWGTDGIGREISMARREGVVATGFVPERLRNSLYEGAVALAYPSLYEGFGLPLLEAFRAGTPVVTSSVSSLPEVAGDAALYADPRDTDGLAEEMVRIAEDSELRVALVARGRVRVRRFSWDRAARETLEVYENA